MSTPPKPSPAFNCPYPTNTHPPEVVSDLREYYYRDVNGDMIRVGGISISPMRSPAAIMDAIITNDRRKADDLIKAIVDEIINRTDVMPAEIYHWRICNDNVMRMVTDYFKTTPYKITKTESRIYASGEKEWKWFVDFRNESEGLVAEVERPKREATMGDVWFAIGCVLVGMLFISYLASRVA